LVPPPCALARVDDLDEVDAMLEAGEVELAREELRYLLQECPDFLAAHQKLGEIAAELDDMPLARAHFGHVFDLVRKALSGEARNGTLPYGLVDNRVGHESGKGLAYALRALGNDDMARDVVEQLLAWDASDPLNLRAWRDG
jgi:hypothetical protein